MVLMKCFFSFVRFSKLYPIFFLQHAADERIRLEDLRNKVDIDTVTKSISSTFYFPLLYSYSDDMICRFYQKKAVESLTLTLRRN
jgi:hypothetical protein